MVRINLLPKERKTKSKPLPQKFIIILAILTYLFIGTSYIFLEKKEDNLNKKLQKLNTELKKYAYINKEIKKIQKKKKVAEEKLKILIKLLEKNPILIQETDIIVKNIPQGKLFFEEFDYKNDQISIKGNSIDLKSIAQYIRKLEKYKNFKKITLEETKQKIIDNQQFINFKLIIEKKS